MLSKIVSQAQAYAKNALERRFWPDRLIETNTTPYRIIYQDGLMCVRSYRAANPQTDKPQTRKRSGHGAESFEQAAGAVEQKEPQRTPVLFIPPLGVPAWIFDLMQDRSFVRFFAQAGWDVYLIDWGSPGLVDAHYDLNHYVTDWLPKAVAAVCKEAAANTGVSAVSLVGYCMGGLMALMYLGARDDAGQPLPWQSAVKNVVTIASPVDFHDTAGKVGKVVNFALSPLKVLDRRMPSVFHRLEQALPGKYFHVPGKMVSHAFAMTQPLSRLTSYFNLLWNLADRSYVIQYTALSRWFDDMLDYPGGVVQNMIFEVVPANRLKLGGIRLGAYCVDLGHVQANLLAVIGLKDTLVSPSAAASIMALVGAKDTTLIKAPGGHAGVFAGHGAAEYTWRPIHEWLLGR